jgi:hypothetical protein
VRVGNTLKAGTLIRLVEHIRMPDMCVGQYILILKDVTLERKGISNALAFYHKNLRIYDREFEVVA